MGNKASALIIVLALVIVGVAAGTTVFATAATRVSVSAAKTVVIDVEGMTCEGCAKLIDETLNKLKGVISAKASYKNKNVKVVYNPKEITLAEIKKAISDLGYTPK